jgi:Domain of unknown function (DUF4282)
VRTNRSVKGFFASLFDFSFSSMITTKIIKVVYVIEAVVISLCALGFLVYEVKQGGAGVLIGIVGAPIGWLFYMIVARMWCELWIVIFRFFRDVREDVRRISDRASSEVAIPFVGALAGGHAAQPSPLPEPTGTFFCSACGSSLAPGAQFCPACNALTTN